MIYRKSKYNIRYSSVTNENLTDVSLIVVNMTLQIELILPSSQIQLDVNCFKDQTPVLRFNSTSIIVPNYDVTSPVFIEPNVPYN